MAKRKRPTDDVEDAEMVESSPEQTGESDAMPMPDDTIPGADDTPVPDPSASETISETDEEITPAAAEGDTIVDDGDPVAGTEPQTAEPDPVVLPGDDAPLPDSEASALQDDDSFVPTDETEAADQSAEADVARAGPVVTPWGGAAADIHQRSTTDPNSPDYVAPQDTAPAETASADDHGYDDYEEQPSIASRILLALVLIVAGGALFLWGAPKLAPVVEPYSPTVANWLAPGQRAVDARTEEVEARLNARIDELALGLGEEEVASRIDSELLASEERMAALTTDLSDRVNALSDQVAAADSTPIEERLGQVEVALEGLRAEMEALRADLTGVAESADGAVGENAAEIDAFAAALGGLRAELALLAQQNGNLSQRIDEVSATAERQIEEARLRVAEAEAEANAEVMEATETADMIAVRNALETGGAYESALEGLAEQAEIPEGLSASAASGVATQEELEARFPDLAHDAIRTAIEAEGADEGVLGSASAFFRARVSGRSLTEMEGDDADAVLSRVEARLKEQDLEAALIEAEALDEGARDVLSDWLSDVRARADALDGYATLSDRLDAAN